MFRLIEGSGRSSGTGWDAPPFDLSVQSTRPGFAQEPVELSLGATLLDSACEAAGADGLELLPWLALAIESERALHALHAADPHGALVGLLNEVAARPAPPTLGGPVRLRAYAAALREVRPSPPRAGGSQPLTIPVPYHSAAAWTLAAAEQGLTVSEWTVSRLDPLPRGRHLWEAAAAESGSTLAEWIAFQAARRSRRSV